MHSRSLFVAALVVAPVIPTRGLSAQQETKVPRPIAGLDVKTPRQADPVKGYGEVAPLAAPPAAEPVRPHAAGPVAERMLAASPVRGAVAYDTAADGTVWASGATYKASFGAAGFTYLPFLGSDAPRNYPVQFTVQAVTVGGRAVAVAGPVRPVRDGDRVVFDRGAVREIYDVGLRGVEQTFVVDGTWPGEVVVELAVTSELRDDPARPGLQFGNERGAVDYGTAFLVDGERKAEIASSFDGHAIRLQVPAAQRTAGAVVIDPLISTSYTSMTPAQNFARPDIAFDATTSRYMLVWQHDFSATDVDIFAELRHADGTVIGGTLTAIDNSTAHWSRPRVANLNAYNRFLVVAERYYPGNPSGQRYQVWGKTQNAAYPYTQSQPFEVSNGTSGDKREPDVGGDPSPLPPTYWTVVYTRELTATDHDVHARQVDSTAGLRAPIMIENSSNTIYRSPRISQSNGDLHYSRQRWLVVYSYQYSSTDWDVYGATLTWDGTIDQASRGIDTSSRSDLEPGVSSATDAVPGAPTFGVVYRTANTPYLMLGKVLDDAVATVVPMTNLGNLVSAVGNVQHPRIETDGCRFVFSYTTVSTYAATLGVVGASFVVHETPQQLGANYYAHDAELTSRGTGGGTDTGYAFVFADHWTTPHKIVFAAYDGHGAGGMLVRSTGCNGLGITGTGSPLLGHAVTATLTGTGADLVGMMVGLPLNGVPLCPGCLLGVQLGGPLVNLPNLATLQLPIPTNHAFVGASIAVQGYAVGAGTCLGVLRLGDTLDLTIQ